MPKSFELDQKNWVNSIIQGPRTEFTLNELEKGLKYLININSQKLVRRLFIPDANEKRKVFYFFVLEKQCINKDKVR